MGDDVALGNMLTRGSMKPQNAPPKCKKGTHLMDFWNSNTWLVIVHVNNTKMRIAGDTRQFSSGGFADRAFLFDPCELYAGFTRLSVGTVAANAGLTTGLFAT